MTALGWVLFISANLAVIALTAYCFKKVFSLEQEHLHSTLEINTKDINTKDINTKDTNTKDTNGGNGKSGR